MIYQQLIEEYNKLTDEEKNALFVYKSRLGRAMNSLGNNDEEIEEIYQEYKQLLSNPKNMFMYMTVFKNINFNDVESFKESLQKVEQEVKKTTKLIISKDITVYRAISIKEPEKLDMLSKTDLISTSLDMNECTKFLIPNQGYQHYLYQINLEKGSEVAICPYAILLNSSEEQLVLTQRKDQEEIILDKAVYEFTQELSTTTKLENNEELNIIVVDAKPKNNRKQHNNQSSVKK